MIALFMAGGSGTRLWPLSRENDPKQLQALIGERSLMTATVERIKPIIRHEDVWIVTAKRYADRIAEHAPQVPREQIVAEPFPLGTSLAVGLGALRIAQQDPDAVMFVGWADSYIGNDAEFCAALRLAERIAPTVDGVILGVRPTYPATGYGYLQLGPLLTGEESVYEIARFEEKPDTETARKYFASGNYLWNPGISVWQVSRLLKLMERYKPDHFAALMKVQTFLGTPNEDRVMREAFKDLDRAPIDTAIFEKAEHLATIPADLAWSDIGSWDTLYEVQASPEGGNVTKGQVVSVETTNCLIYGVAGKRLIATLGISDLVIVDTKDALLIARREDAERLKELHTAIKAAGGIEYL